jgi:hypothetical protein
MGRPVYPTGIWVDLYAYGTIYGWDGTDRLIAKFARISQEVLRDYQALRIML